jgi:hypothetical protein
MNEKGWLGPAAAVGPFKLGKVLFTTFKNRAKGRVKMRATGI